MLNKSTKTIVSSKVARWQIERITWLIEVLCPDYGPLRSALQITDNAQLIDMPRLSDAVIARTQTSPLSPQDYIDLHLWAQDYMDTLKRRIGMSDWPVQYVARDPNLPKRKTDRTLIGQADYKGRGRYVSDADGQPVIYFDQAQLSRLGYIETHISHGLAELVLLEAPKLSGLLEDRPQQMIALTAAFLGLGLICAKATDPADNAEDIFASAIFLSLKGHNAKKVKMIYGSALEPALTQALDDAFAQLENYKPQLDRLRMMIIHADTFSREKIA